MTRRVALVTHDYKASGGVAAMTAFLYRALKKTARFEPEIISLAMSSSDSASIRLRSPASWVRTVQVLEGERQGLAYRHIGARFCEFEFQRYKPRRQLTEILNRYDIVQFVVGTPPWFCAAIPSRPPKFLWTATVTRSDRANRLAKMTGLRKWWSEWMTRMSEKIERKALKSAEAVLALSDYTLKCVRQIAGNEVGQIAVSGVDTEFFQPNGSPGDYFLCVGRLEDPRKNIRLLLRAYAKVNARVPNAPELWLAGPHSPEIETAISEIGISNKVRLVGRKATSELPELYRSATAFVLSSDEEGLGIVLLEAMASGIPVISTACGGPETVVKDGLTGFLVPLGDADAIANAMEKLLRDKRLREHMGALARKDVLDRFSFSAAVKPFVNAYDAV